jgi:hypothetical protein
MIESLTPSGDEFFAGRARWHKGVLFGRLATRLDGINGS